MDSADKGLKQDWAVFKALAPGGLIKLVHDKSVDFIESTRIMQMLYYLGFGYLYNEYVIDIYLGKYMKAESKQGTNIVDELNGTFLAGDYIKSFIENIENTELRNMFDSKVGYLI